MHELKNRKSNGRLHHYAESLLSVIPVQKN